MFQALPLAIPDPAIQLYPANDEDDLLSPEEMNGHDYDLVGCSNCLPRDRFLTILIPATSAAPINVDSNSEARLIEEVLNECERQLRELEARSPSAEQHPGFGVDDVFAAFWAEFTTVFRLHPECHFQLTRFLHGFLDVVEKDGRAWFEPKVKLGKELLEKNLNYWLEEVGNNVQEALKEYPLDDDSALDDDSVKSYINYFTFLAHIARDDNLPIDAMRKISSALYDALSEGYTAEQRPWRDAALLAWAKIIAMIGPKAFEDFRDEWIAAEQKARDIATGRFEQRRMKIQLAAREVAERMKDLREQADNASRRLRSAAYG